MHSFHLTPALPIDLLYEYMLNIRCGVYLYATTYIQHIFHTYHCLLIYYMYICIYGVKVRYVDMPGYALAYPVGRVM